MKSRDKPKFSTDCYPLAKSRAEILRRTDDVHIVAPRRSILAESSVELGLTDEYSLWRILAYTKVTL